MRNELADVFTSAEMFGRGQHTKHRPIQRWHPKFVPASTHGMSGDKRQEPKHENAAKDCRR
jgi:hypothetical protein